MTTSMFVLALALVAVALSRLSRSVLIVATIAVALGIAAIWQRRIRSSTMSGCRAGR